MRSLTLRFFLSFWLIIVTLTALAGVAGYAYSERMREALENFEMSDTVLAASAVLDEEGKAGLVRWLDRQQIDSPMNVLIVDDRGKELLDRAVPYWAERLMRRFDHRHRDWSPEWREPPNLKRARPLTRLRARDGEIFTLIVSPKRHPLQQWVGARAGPAFLGLAVLLSAGVSFVLARAIARPVRAMREATVAIAEGKLDTRVAATTRRRKDEIGLLAQDLDNMAGRLEAAANRQQELTRNISHELRSPLARLRVALELARRQAGDLPEFGRIDDETERLDAMIGQLLSYARLDADGERRRLDLRELLQDVVDDANFECRSSGLVGVSVALEAESPLAVDATAPALRSAFENVLRNAIHHSPPDAAVEVRARRGDGRVLVTVRDRGRGVAEDEIGAIFEPFFRSADAMSQDADGSGLGLAIAARAIEKNGGSIRARNLDDGFAIEIELPAAGPSG